MNESEAKKTVKESLEKELLKYVSKDELETKLFIFKKVLFYNSLYRYIKYLIFKKGLINYLLKNILKINAIY